MPGQVKVSAIVRVANGTGRGLIVTVEEGDEGRAQADILRRFHEFEETAAFVNTIVFTVEPAN